MSITHEQIKTTGKIALIILAILLVIAMFKKLLIESVALLIICGLIFLYLHFIKKSPDKSPDKSSDKSLDKKSLLQSINQTQSKTKERVKNAATKIVGTKETPVYIIKNFLTHKECDQLIKEFKGRLTPSPLTRADPNDKYFRTSTTGFFYKKDGIQGIIENKILNLIGQDPKIAEDSQMQHYEVGQEFKPHYDWFDPQADPSFYKKGQRTFTVTLYCNDVEEGGETYFTKLKYGIKPEKGQAVVWYNLTDDLNGNTNTMHTGTPVLKGEKWIVTKWFKWAQNPD